MKYTPSALMSEFSGAQGSTVASHNRYGPYLRNRTIPTNPASARQLSARAILTSATQAWKNITDAQRNAWDEAAALIPLIDSLGKTYFRTGHQFYVSTWAQAYLYGTITGGPPDPGTVVPPIDLSSMVPAAAAGAATFTVTFAATPVPALTALRISATPMLSAGVTYVSRAKLRFVQLIAAAGTSPANIKVAYVALYGALVAGKKIMVETEELSSTGGKNNRIRAIITVAA